MFDDVKIFFGRKDTQTVLIVFLVLLIVYFSFKGDIDAFFKRTFNLEEGDIDEGALDRDLLLKKGSSGAEVGVLQTLLIRDGFALPKYGADRIFGSETENALLQAKNVKEITLNDYGSFLLARTTEGALQIIDEGMLETQPGVAA